MENSNFYNLLTDGSTDFSATEKEALFIMIFDTNPIESKKIQIKINVLTLLTQKQQM